MVEMSRLHQAVEHEDLPRLGDLLDAGGDVHEEWNGMSLLHHAIDAERDGANQTGEPLHVDTTAYLLARGADPTRRDHGGVGVTAYDFALGNQHWLAVTLFDAWLETRGIEPAEPEGRVLRGSLMHHYRLLHHAWGVSVWLRARVEARPGGRGVRQVDGLAVWLEFSGAAAELSASMREVLLAGLTRVAPRIVDVVGGMASCTVVVDEVIWAETDFQEEFLEVVMCRWAEEAFGLEPAVIEEWFDKDENRYRFEWR